MQYMYSLLILLSSQPVSPPNPSDNIIGIGGIIATLVGVLISVFVTWKVAQKDRKEMKLEYHISAVPLLSNTSIIDISKPQLDIQYNGYKIHEPYLLTVDVYNTGNTAIKKTRYYRQIIRRISNHARIHRQYSCWISKQVGGIRNSW